MPQNVNDSAFLSQYTSKPSKYLDILNQSKLQSSQNSELGDEGEGYKRINSYFKRKSSIQDQRAGRLDSMSIANQHSEVQEQHPDIQEARVNSLIMSQPKLNLGNESMVSEGPMALNQTQISLVEPVILMDQQMSEERFRRNEKDKKPKLVKRAQSPGKRPRSQLHSKKQARTKVKSIALDINTLKEQAKRILMQENINNKGPFQQYFKKKYSQEEECLNLTMNLPDLRKAKKEVPALEFKFSDNETIANEVPTDRDGLSQR